MGMECPRSALTGVSNSILILILILILGLCFADDVVQGEGETA